MKMLLAVIAGFTLVSAAGAQQPIDRIVAIVGTRPILASQVEEEMVQAQAQGQPLPPDSAGRMLMRHQILDHPFAGKSAAARHYHSLGHALSPLQFIKPSGFAAPLITPPAS